MSVLLGCRHHSLPGERVHAWVHGGDAVWKWSRCCSEWTLARVWEDKPCLCEFPIFSVSLLSCSLSSLVSCLTFQFVLLFWLCKPLIVHSNLPCSVQSSDRLSYIPTCLAVLSFILLMLHLNLSCSFLLYQWIHLFLTGWYALLSCRTSQWILAVQCTSPWAMVATLRVYVSSLSSYCHCCYPL